MLNCIKGISNFGVFSNHPAEVHFLKFNLFYGWNGSGKSTLSRVFASFSDTHSSIFPEGDFKIQFQSKDYTKANVNTSGIRIATFNQDFIKANLSFEDHRAKSILYISEEKIEEKRQLEEKQKALEAAKYNYNQKKAGLDALNDEISSEHTKIAKNVKNSFGLIQTKNSKFLNYDKRKLESFLTSNKDKIKNESTLSEEEIEKNKLAAQATQKPNLNRIDWPFDISNTQEIVTKTKEIVEKSIVAAQIEKLSSNQELNKWIESGLVIHKKTSATSCEFCGNTLSKQRVKELEAHFSNEYQQLLSDITVNVSDLSALIKNLEFSLHDSGDFYAELQSSVKNLKKESETKKIEIKSKLEEFSKKMESKRNNPFQVITWQDVSIKDDFYGLEEIVKNFNSLIDRHNAKTFDFNTSVETANNALELHFVSDQLSDGTLAVKKNNVATQEQDLMIAQATRDSLDKEVKNLEAKLVNVAIAAEKFNKELENFIGRSDIQLEFNTEKGGYVFYRNGRREIASNLSEGEKTAIAFIYFITKLKEAGSSIENTIVVLDDPISSFDSKNLHSAFGFIQHHLGNAKQFFVFTHNFEFFKLIRNWLKNKNRPNKNGVKNEKAKFYLLQSKLEKNKTCEIVDLPPHLLNYESEYHFLFEKVLSFKDEKNPTFEKAHFIGNGSRKILEAFLAFKYPSYRSDFAGLLKKACADDSNTYQKVFSFINRYSHSETLEVFESGSDNIFAESQNIISDVFQIIKKLDANHYEEMEQLCS